mmetsp:Transcript_39279/g.116880  ORF Transcript_39279/g.116880 Transcript_39279/m.116880 type:complete len:143 (-) Transcript_39279:990-1418(-)
MALLAWLRPCQQHPLRLSPEQMANLSLALRVSQSVGVLLKMAGLVHGPTTVLQTHPCIAVTTMNINRLAYRVRGMSFARSAVDSAAHAVACLLMFTIYLPVLGGPKWATSACVLVLTLAAQFAAREWWAGRRGGRHGKTKQE